MRRLMRAIDRAVEAVVVVVFAAIIVVGTAQVFNRYFLNASLSWSEEFQRYGHIWLVFLAIPIAYRRGMHMGVEGLRKYLRPRALRWFTGLVDVLWLVLGGAIALGTSRFLGVLGTQRSAGLGLPMDWVYAGVLGGAVYMLLIGVRRLAALMAGYPVADARGEA